MVGWSGLDLPAVEGGAVVGEDGFPARHEMFGRYHGDVESVIDYTLSAARS